MSEPMHTALAKVEAYVTRDGSIIRELMHPTVHGNALQSLAEATLAPGGRTLLHQHAVTEEIYHFTAGTGVMTLGSRRLEVSAGDTVCIPPGTPHRLDNTGNEELKLLCACSPAYAHDDTELL
jgi:mannose-6-phosphate isomerase-like protein (cupin superfamily)